MAAVTLQGSIEKAHQIKTMISERKPDENIRKLAQELYKDAVVMVAAELQGNPIIPDEKTVHPIMKDLHIALEGEGHQSFIELQRTLSKTFRVFIEISWYQSWRLGVKNKEEKVRVPDTFRDGLINTSKLIKTILQNRSDVTGARFELRCAKQAAKRLEPSTDLWKQYMMHVANLTAAGGARSATAIWDALKPLLQDLERDIPLGWHLWYQQAHIMRWESAQVQTVQDFEEKIVPKISLCKKKGDNLSLCLATVLIELIKKPNLDLEVKRRALCGKKKSVESEEQEGLIHLIAWERPDTVKDSFKHPSEIYHKLFRKADRFWETRDLTTRFLGKLATQDKYKEYREASLTALQTRNGYLANQKSKAYTEEKRKLSVTLEAVEKEFEDIEDQLADVGEQLLLLDPNKRGGEPFDQESQERKKTLDAQEALLAEKFETLEDKISEIKKRNNNVSTWLDMTNREAELISELLKAS